MDGAVVCVDDDVHLFVEIQHCRADPFRFRRSLTAAPLPAPRRRARKPSRRAAPAGWLRGRMNFPGISKLRLAEILGAGHNKCENCGQQVEKIQSQKGVPTPSNQLQRHHKKPAAQGGPGTADNGKVLCKDCHVEEHRKLWQDQP